MAKDGESKYIISVETKKAVEESEKLRKKLKETGESGDKTGKSFKKLKKETSGLTSGVKNLVAGFSALKFASFIKSSIDATNSITRYAEKLGETTEAYSTLSHAGKRAGMDADDFGDTMVDMSERISEALLDGTGEGAEAIKRLGLTANDFDGVALSGKMKLIADAMVEMEDPADKIWTSMQLFGESGAKLIPILNQGADGISDMEDEARDLGLTLTTETSVAVKELGRKIGDMEGAFAGATLTMLTALAPAFDTIGGSADDVNSASQILNRTFLYLGRTAGALVQLVSTGAGLIGTAWRALMVGVGKSYETMEDISSDADSMFDDMLNSFTKMEGAEERQKKQLEENKLATEKLREEEEKRRKKILEQIEGRKRLTKEERDGEQATRDQNDATREWNRLEEERVRRMSTLEGSYRRLVHSVDENIRKDYELNAVMDLLAQSVVELGVTSEYAEELLDKYMESVSETAKESVDEVSFVAEEFSKFAGNVAEEFGSTMTKQLIDGEADWTDFASAVVGEIARIIVQLVTLKALQDATTSPSIGGSFSSLLGGAVGSSVGTSSGATATAIAPLSAGVSSLGTPSPSSTGAGSSRSASVNVPVSVNVEGNASSETAEQLSVSASYISATVRSEILNDIRRGGEFARAVGVRR